MPAEFRAQQSLAAMALHNPSKIHKKNRGILSMSREKLRHFATTSTKGMPKHKKPSMDLVSGK